MSSPNFDVLLKAEPLAPGDEDTVRGPSPAENCAKIKHLGFTVSKHVKMYGERFEIVSDPFSEGDCVSVHAISGTGPEIRILRLPTTMLVGGKSRSLKKRDSAGVIDGIVRSELSGLGLEREMEKEKHNDDADAG